MIRTVLGVLYVVLYCIISLPILLVESVIRLFAPRQAELSMLRIVQAAFRGLLWVCGTKVTVIGRENIPEKEAVLFVGNHRSYFDIIISYTHMKARCGYIAKDTLDKLPILNWNMRFLFCLFLKRDDLKQGLETIKKAIDYVKNGISVFVFPEGHRSKGPEHELLPFHKGSFKIAQRTKCSIVPVAFHNTRSVWEAQFPRVKPTHVVVEYGKPIPYDSLTREEQKGIDDHFRGILSGMVKKLAEADSETQNH